MSFLKLSFPPLTNLSSLHFSHNHIYIPQCMPVTSFAFIFRFLNCFKIHPTVPPPPDLLTHPLTIPNLKWIQQSVLVLLSHAWKSRYFLWLAYCKFMIFKLIWKSALIHGSFSSTVSYHAPLFLGLPSPLAFLLIALPDDGLMSYFTKKITAFRLYFQVHSSFPFLLFKARKHPSFFRRL